MTKTKFIAEAGKQEIIVSAVFNAPRERVFKAMTDPNLIPQWWGPRVLTTTIDKMDPRNGGVWRFVQRDPQHNEYAFHGVYHEVMAPERMIYTFEYEGAPGHVILTDVSFSGHNGQTTMTEKSIFMSVEDRDGMLNEGMEDGEIESMQRLAELVEGK
jgi:uncharacterized protein YndB with AHSA1/START domain